MGKAPWVNYSTQNSSQPWIHDPKVIKTLSERKSCKFPIGKPHLHPKASVRFISAILSQCLLVCHGRERSRNGAFFLRPGMLQEALYEPLDPSLIYKRHLYIYLKTENKGGNSTLATGCAFTLLMYSRFVSTKPAKQETIHEMTSQHDCISLGMCLGSPSRLMTQATASSESEWGKDDKDTMTRRSSLERTRLTQPGISRLRNGMSDLAGQQEVELSKYNHCCNSHICTWGTAASQGQESCSHPTPISKGSVCETCTKQLCTPQAEPDYQD